MAENFWKWRFYCLLHVVSLKIYSADILTTKKEYIKTETPGIIMLERKDAKELMLTVVDPTQKLQTFNLRISGKYSAQTAVYNDVTNETKIKIKLPINEKAGSSVTIKLKKK